MPTMGNTLTTLSNVFNKLSMRVYENFTLCIQYTVLIMVYMYYQELPFIPTCTCTIIVIDQGNSFSLWVNNEYFQFMEQSKCTCLLCGTWSFCIMACPLRDISTNCNTSVTSVRMSPSVCCVQTHLLFGTGCIKHTNVSPSYEASRLRGDQHCSLYIQVGLYLFHGLERRI